MYDACWTKRFCAPNNIVKYDGKTNLSDWLVDYHITCRAGGADNDLFIIQFLPIYLVDMSRASLDHLPRNSIDCWEGLLLHRQHAGHIHVARQSLGSEGLLAEAGGIPIGLHPEFLPKVS
jgi:hypothetical protein